MSVKKGKSVRSKAQVSQTNIQIISLVIRRRSAVLSLSRRSEVRSLHMLYVTIYLGELGLGQTR